MPYIHVHVFILVLTVDNNSLATTYYLQQYYDGIYALNGDVYLK